MSAPALRYKFVELSIVTSETIEEAVNEHVGQGWAFDSIRFVTTEASRRPCMAFVSFIRDDAEAAPPRRRRVTSPAPASPSPSTSRRRR